MPDQVTVNDYLKIIEVRSFDLVSTAHMTETIETVKRLHNETGIDKVLIDARGLTSLPGTADIYELTKTFPRNMKIAILFLGGGEVFEQISFSETVASNRGVTIKIFDSDTEALDWLNS